MYSLTDVEAAVHVAVDNNSELHVTPLRRDVLLVRKAQTQKSLVWYSISRTSTSERKRKPAYIYRTLKALLYPSLLPVQERMAS